MLEDIPVVKLQAVPTLPLHESVEAGYKFATLSLTRPSAKGVSMESRARLRNVNPGSVIMALVCLLTCVSAQSQPPKPPEQSSATKNVRPANAQQSGAPQTTQQPAVPPTITVVHPEKTASELAEDKRQREREMEIQAQMLRFNGYLVFVGFLQIAGMIFGVIYTGMAAHAARKSAKVAEDTLRLTQRAELSFLQPSLTLRIGERPKATFLLSNIGPTRALVSRDVARLVIAQELPGAPDYSRGHELTGRMLIGGKQDRSRTVWIAEPLDAAVHAAITAGRISVFVFGRVEYDDIFERPHTYGYILRYRAPDGQFSAAPEYPEYHYSD